MNEEATVELRTALEKAFSSSVTLLEKMSGLKVAWIVVSDTKPRKIRIGLEGEERP